MNVEIVKRTAAYPATLHDIDPLENLVLQKAEALSLPPERFGDLSRRSREVRFVPLAAALKDTNRSPRLREAARRNGPSEPGAYNHDIVGIFQVSFSSAGLALIRNA